MQFWRKPALQNLSYVCLFVFLVVCNLTKVLIVTIIVYNFHK